MEYPFSAKVCFLHVLSTIAGAMKIVLQMGLAESI
jgi:hypothetical protein